MARELGSGLSDTVEGFVSSTLVTFSADSSFHLAHECSKLNVVLQGLECEPVAWGLDSVVQCDLLLL